jgi:CBS domain-containing protein
MALIYDLVKDRRVYSIEADHTVLEAARFMLEHHIGALPVLWLTSDLQIFQTHISPRC